MMFIEICYHLSDVFSVKVTSTESCTYKILRSWEVFNHERLERTIKLYSLGYVFILILLVNTSEFLTVFGSSDRIDHK